MRAGDPPPPWEIERMEAQRAFDAARPAPARNRMGQFATPGAFARQLVRLGLSHLPPSEPVSFLDPALGTGAFYSALLSELGERPLAAASGVELDPELRRLAGQLWAGRGLALRAGDFTAAEPREEDRVNLLIANPPYVRHHHIDRAAKAALGERVRRATGLRLSGLASLYCAFLLLSRAWMRPGGVAVWLIPSEFMDVNYGAVVKRFLLEQVTLLRVHRADPAERLFEDALVSTAVVVLRNRPPPAGHRVRFSFGGAIERPALEDEVEADRLAEQPKWTRFPGAAEALGAGGARLGELFTIRRGLATGGNGLFILDGARAAALDLPPEHLRPILPPPRRLRVDRVRARPDGSPELPEAAWLIDCALPEAELRGRFPALWRYLQTGVPRVSSGYLCSRRSPWYAQESRAPAPLLCTYMGRGQGGRPFRFILNESAAVAANVYLMLYPSPAVAAEPGRVERVWRALNGLAPEALQRAGRVYGGGLFKLEPAELAALRLPDGV